MIARPEDTPDPLPEPEPKPGNNGHKGGNGKTVPQTQAERLAALHAKPRDRTVKPKDKIPPRTMTRMRRYFAAIEEGLEPKPAAEKARVSWSSVKTNGWWRLRYPRFEALEAEAVDNGTKKMRAIIRAAMIEQGITGVVETTHRKFSKDGALLSEHVTRRRAPQVLLRLENHFFPEFREASGTSVNVTVNQAEEHRYVLTVLSDPEARAVLRRAHERARLGAGEPGDAGRGVDPPGAG